VSLQRRLVAVMAILLVVGLVVADVVTYASVRSFLYGRADDTLASVRGLAFNYVAYAAERGLSRDGGRPVAARLTRRVRAHLRPRREGDLAAAPRARPTGPTRPAVVRLIPVQQVPDITAGCEFGRYAGTFRPDPDAVSSGAGRSGRASTARWPSTVPQGTMYVALS
jgi:hypothetical protein